MKETKVYIVEDMAVSRMALENLLLDNDFEVCGSAASAEKALRQPPKKHYVRFWNNQ